MEKIHTTLSTVIDHCMPYKECVIKHKQIRREPWLTASIKISIDRNKKLYAKMLRKECSTESYKRYNHLLCKTIRHAKTKFYNDMCCEYKCQTRKLWGLINEISGKKMKIATPAKLVQDYLKRLQSSQSCLFLNPTDV